jgi:hypothetical protein
MWFIYIAEREISFFSLTKTQFFIFGLPCPASPCINTKLHEKKLQEVLNWTIIDIPA